VLGADSFYVPVKENVGFFLDYFTFKGLFIKDERDQGTLKMEKVRKLNIEKGGMLKSDPITGLWQPRVHSDVAF